METNNKPFTLLLIIFSSQCKDRETINFLFHFLFYISRLAFHKHYNLSKFQSL